MNPTDAIITDDPSKTWTDGLPYRLDVGRLAGWPPTSRETHARYVVDECDRLVDGIERRGGLTDEEFIWAVNLPPHMPSAYPEVDKRDSYDRIKQVEEERATIHISPRDHLAHLDIRPVLQTRADVDVADAWRLDDAPDLSTTDAVAAAVSSIDIPHRTIPTRWGSFTTRTYAAAIVRLVETLRDIEAADDRGPSSVELYTRLPPSFSFAPDEFGEEVLGPLASLSWVDPPTCDPWLPGADADYAFTLAEHVCEACGRAFSTAQALGSHRQTHAEAGGTA